MFFLHRQKLCIKHTECCLFYRHHVWFFPIWCWILPHQRTTLSRQMKTSRNLIVEFIRLEIRNVNLFLFGYFFLYISFMFHFVSLFSSISLYMYVVGRMKNAFLPKCKENHIHFPCCWFFFPRFICHPSHSNEIWDKVMPIHYTSKTEIPKRNQLIFVRAIILF